jgi:NAD binding domain of 6-phosphogluconate dehydrogenase
MKVGFIGVGDQEAPMATRVLGAGHELLVYARRPEVRAHFAELVAEVVGAPAELGACELVRGLQLLRRGGNLVYDPAVDLGEYTCRIAVPDSSMASAPE